MKYYQIWDNFEKSYAYSTMGIYNIPLREVSLSYIRHIKSKMLADGEHYNKSEDVLVIHEFNAKREFLGIVE